MSQGVTEDDRICLEILNKSGYYEILEVDQKEKIEVIKKTYRSKALRIHPDKNKSAYARDAFQKLSKAYVCLNSPMLRKVYDATGNEELTDSTIMQSFDENFADKVFSDVLSDYCSEPNSQVPIYKTHLVKFLLLQLLPIFLILFLCLYTTSLQNTEEFSLSMSPHYNIRRVVRPQNLTYFVNSDLYRELNLTQIQELDKKVFRYYERKKDKAEEEEQQQQKEGQGLKVEVSNEISNYDEL